MSLKDDFLEALNSVKRDLTREDEESAKNAEDAAEAAGGDIPFDVSFPPPERPITDRRQDEVVFEAFKQASVIDQASAADDDDDEEPVGDRIHTDPYMAAPFRSFNPSSLPHADAAETTENGGPDAGSGAAPEIIQSGTGGADFYSDDKTVISRNTVIRGTLQTEDSVRLLGQIMGDIECKSNIVIAGKVRGNTSAANAFIMDAQVDGSVYCDDAISISSDAWVLGSIRAGQADIDGKIKGNLEVRNSVSIGSTSSVIGNISTDELEIKRGAFINGQIMMYTPSRDVLDRFDHFER